MAGDPLSTAAGRFRLTDHAPEIQRMIQIGGLAAMW
jgi:hypothetical protein